MKYETMVVAGLILFTIGLLIAGVGFGIALHGANHYDKPLSCSDEPQKSPERGNASGFGRAHGSPQLTEVKESRQ